MTNAEFLSRYKLLKRLTDGAVRSYTGHQLAPRRVVMVHFLESAERAERQATLALLARLDAFDAVKLLDIVDVDDTTAVVTVYLEGFTTLRAWLDARARRQPTALDGIDGEAHMPDVESQVGIEARQPVAPAPALQPPGEFTRLFGRESGREGAVTASADASGGGARDESAASPDPRMPLSPNAPPPARGEPGEFTRLFAARPEMAAEPEGARQEPSSVPNPEERREERPRAGRDEPSPPALPALDPAPDRALDRQPLSSPAAPEESPPGTPRGLTDIIGAVVVPGAAAAPPVVDWLRASSHDDAEQTASAGGGAAPFPGESVASSAAAAGAMRGWADPGSFTQVVAGGAGGPAPHIPAAIRNAGHAPAAPAVPLRTSYLPLIILLGVAFAAAAGLILYFVLTRG